MTGTIDRATLDRLIALGRVRGELTASELQAALPVDALDVDALVLVMLELEEAGISVEPDAFGPRAETGPLPRLTLPLPDPGVPQTTAMAASEARLRETAPPAAPAQAKAKAGEAEGDDVTRVVLLAGLAVVLILGLVLVFV